MNLHYISGFFDADGSITLSKQARTDKYKSIKLDFTNTNPAILYEIKNYLYDNYQIPTYISTKPSKKENHAIGYTLSTNSNQSSLKLCRLLDSHHSKKKHRINTVLKYHDLVTKRNGKYNTKQIMRKLAYERLFFSTIFQ